MRRSLIFALSILLVVACAPPPTPTPVPASASRRPLGANDTEYTIRHDTVIRTYVLHAPPGALPDKPHPVVVMLWDGGSADTAIAQSGWAQKADAEGFIVAFGQADRGLWNDGSPFGEAGRVKNGDIGYVAALFSDVRRHFTVDPKRLFVAGYGTGGSVAWAAAGELSGQVSAVGMVGGHLFSSSLNIERGTPLLYVVGTADPQYPLNGGRVVDQSGATTTRAPIQQTFDRWLVLMRCTLTPNPVSDVDGVRTVVYRGCRDGTENMLQTIDGMAHLWPGGPRPAGIVSRDKIDATAVLWDFFTKHPRP